MSQTTAFLLLILIVFGGLGILVLRENIASSKRKEELSREICCPKCGSKRYHSFVEQQVIRGEKTKATYSANLNPFKPFTFVNKKEEVVRNPLTVNVSRFVCDDCGQIFN